LFFPRQRSKLYWARHGATTTALGEDDVHTTGRVIDWANGYDLLVWLVFLGRERTFRDRLVELARLEPGQSVLDIGCGTGSLAIAATRRVGPSGSVDGIDASSAMIARARRKAGKAGAAATFTTSIVEDLPFPDGRFDRVLSTMMLHHLPSAARRQCMREVRRTLKPGGIALVVDFGEASDGGKSVIGHFHRHGAVAVRDIERLLGEAGLTVIEHGAVGVGNLNFVRAAAG
jgi:ubiquinone/menaquinone biosynthesis C-methylase UbiE